MDETAEQVVAEAFVGTLLTGYRELSPEQREDVGTIAVSALRDAGMLREPGEPSDAQVRAAWDAYALTGSMRAALVAAGVARPEIDREELARVLMRSDLQRLADAVISDLEATPPSPVIEGRCATCGSEVVEGDAGEVVEYLDADESGEPTSTYISPHLPDMIRNLWKSDPRENSVRTALALAGDLIQELIDLRDAYEPEETEWEYAAVNRSRDFARGVGFTFKNPEDAQRFADQAERLGHPKRTIVRRRRAGEWEEIPNE